MAPTPTNMFTSLDNLSNEASVENFFVSRLLAKMGYKDSQVAPKESLDQLAVHLGRRSAKYRPDYALKYNGKVRWVCDAKGVEEDLDDWVGQCSSYCLELNRRAPDNPVEYFMLTNGVNTDVYKWDNDEPVLHLDFDDFDENNAKYRELLLLLGPAAFRSSRQSRTGNTDDMHILRRKSISEINSDFTWAHRRIYKSESLSYGSAFMEFVKVIFLKLLSDRKVHDSPNGVRGGDGSISVPVDEVQFSKTWIKSREHEHANPMDAIQFSTLLSGLETEILEGTKKRIFPKDEHIRLSNETLKDIAGRFENTDLYGLDADLNGRMFETFLNATLRGKDLGQYFTPRSVAKLATRIADLRATPSHTDIVLDACCGTGGFLIEALTEMWAAIDENKSLSDAEKAKQRDVVAKGSLYGVEIARDPALARIARINMYLHGDGGSRIYHLDALDKKVGAVDTDGTEIRQEKREFKSLLKDNPNGFADVVLTNPPFAKEYSRSQSNEGKLLDDYELGFDTSGKRRREVRTLRSSVMFLERYHDLLVPGGLMVSVVDDGILGGDSYREIRNWLRSRYLIRAVISLPGDAFQRSQARVKTSLLVVEKRDPDVKQDQPPVFMYYCTAVGVDDTPRQRVLPADRLLREAADKEIADVSALYRAFREGKPSAAKWSVPPHAISDRMDVKAIFTKAGASVADWKSSGFEVTTLGDLAEPPTGREVDPDDPASPETFTRMRVRYDGVAEASDEVEPEDLRGRHFVVREGDIVLSHINAIHGAIAVVPPSLDGCIVTHEYSLCRTKNGYDARVVCALLRSPAARADLIILSTGIGRTRIDWGQASDVQVPLPSDEDYDRLVQALDDAEEAESQARKTRDALRRDVLGGLHLDTPDSRALLSAFKPPR